MLPRPLTTLLFLVLVLFPAGAALGAAQQPAEKVPAPGASSLAAILAHDNRVPAGELRGGLLTIHLEARAGIWDPDVGDSPPIEVQAFAEEGHPPTIPGPLIRVPEGTEVLATVRNLIPESTLVVHGLHPRPGDPKDVLEIPPGAMREIRFAAGARGTYFYWAATTGRPIEERVGVDSQLSGAFIVDSRDAASPRDRVFLMGLWLDNGDPKANPPRPDREVVVINGRSWPHTERLTYTVGETIRWRWINATDRLHPMHLHGTYFRVDSLGDAERDVLLKDEDRRWVVTQQMAEGSTMSLTWTPERPGNWLFHCHITAHISLDPRWIKSPPAGHAVHPMAGLVLGIHVLPGRGVLPATRATAPLRKLRLLIGERAVRYGSDPGLGFQLQEGTSARVPESPAAPGPPIVLTRGQPVEITVMNQLQQATSIHWHGIELESYYDGVPGWGGFGRQLTPAIGPGKSFLARFTPPRAGTFIYHSHLQEMLQIGTGIYGPLLVLEPGQKYDPETDKIVLISRDGPDDVNAPVLVNGSAEPPPLHLRVGVKYRFRLINITPNNSALRVSLLAGDSPVNWRAVAKDGANLPPAQATARPAVQTVGVGETYDFEFDPAAPSDLQLEIFRPANKTRVVAAVELR